MTFWGCFSAFPPLSDAGGMPYLVLWSTGMCSAHSKLEADANMKGLIPHICKQPQNVPCSSPILPPCSLGFSDKLAGMAEPSFFLFLVVMALVHSERSSPVPKASPGQERDKGASEEAVQGLAHFARWLVPNKP